MRAEPIQSPHSTAYPGNRGWGLIQMLGALFAGTLILGACVPLYLAAQREADIGMARAKIQLTAREVSARFREDVRQATSVQLVPGGREVRFSVARVRQPGVSDRITYRGLPTGLAREVNPGDSGRPAERTLFGPPLLKSRFEQQDGEVRAEFTFGAHVGGRTLHYPLSCAATPRSN